MNAITQRDTAEEFFSFKSELVAARRFNLNVGYVNFSSYYRNYGCNTSEGDSF